MIPTTNLDNRWMKLLLVLAFILALSALFAICSISAGCGAEIRPIQNNQPRTCCSSNSCKGMHPANLVPQKSSR